MSLEGLLTDFGLSETQVNVYRAVLEGGEVTAGEVADEAGVSQSYVYSVAETLAARDLVTVDEAASPTRLRARPPDEVAATLDERVAELEGTLESLYASRARSVDGFAVLQSRRTVVDHIAETISEATAELLLVLPARIATELHDAIAAATDRGVFTLLLLTGTDDAGDLPVARATTATRSWAASPPSYVIADGVAGTMSEPGMLSGRHGDEETLAFTDRAIADGFVGMALSNYWPMGRTVHQAPPARLPATYDSFRAGIFDAARRIARGEDLVGTVTVADGSRTFEDAPVVDVRQGLVEPTSNEFPNEHSVVFDTDEGAVAVGCPGGIGAFYEDYAGASLTLDRAQ